eukprot:scaffold978_cov392-Prasinococcus_capsulatus_cf.AAC.7
MPGLARPPRGRRRARAALPATAGPSSSSSLTWCVRARARERAREGERGRMDRGGCGSAPGRPAPALSWMPTPKGPHGVGSRRYIPFCVDSCPLAPERRLRGPLRRRGGGGGETTTSRCSLVIYMYIYRCPYPLPPRIEWMAGAGRIGTLTHARAPTSSPRRARSACQRGRFAGVQGGRWALHLLALPLQVFQLASCPGTGWSSAGHL